MVFLAGFAQQGFSPFQLAKPLHDARRMGEGLGGMQMPVGNGGTALLF